MVAKIKEQILSYFVGREDIVENILICLLAGGHILLEDVPGVGKTTLARTLSKALDCDFGRIQFTPDTLPSDVVGNEIYNMKTGEFSYKAGAVLHQIVLADEINRTSPKTQSSLLEAMEEGQVTVGGKVYKLPSPFMVIATQNPVEFAGTYPLPEAEIDRFMMKLSIGYPSKEEELRLARNVLMGKTVDEISGVVSAEDVIKMQAEVSKVRINDSVLEYLRNIIELTRTENGFVIGASPRAMLSLMKASQAKAYLDGRDYVKPDDIKSLAVKVLSHRMILTTEAKIGKEDVTKKLNALLSRVKVPMTME